MYECPNKELNLVCDACTSWAGEITFYTGVAPFQLLLSSCQRYPIQKECYFGTSVLLLNQKPLKYFLYLSCPYLRLFDVFNCLYYKLYGLCCQPLYKLFLLYFNLYSLYYIHNKSTYYLISRCFKTLYHLDNGIMKYNSLPFLSLFSPFLLA